MLSYPSSGDESGWDDQIDRSFDSRIFTQTLLNGAYAVEIQFGISYKEALRNYGSGFPLFSKKQKARFVWKSSLQRFIIDKSNSELTEKELDGTYTTHDDPDCATNEEFLSYNYTELAQLAISGNGNQKNWIKKFLDSCKNTSEKRRLSPLLGRRTASKS